MSILDPKPPTRAELTATYAGVRKVDNGGQVLKTVRKPSLVIDKSFPTRDYDLRILWADGAVLYALGKDSSLYKSTDEGATWTFKSYNSNVNAANGTFLKTSTGTLLAGGIGTPATVWRSTNDGTSWTKVHTMAADSLARPMAVTAWAIDPVTNYIYLGEYQTVDTAISTVNVYRSTDDGATWSVFHAFPGPASTSADKVRHVHAIQWDSVMQRIVVMTGDSDPAAGIYRVNSAGTALEPLVTNRMVTNIPGVTEGGRAIGYIPFPDYIVYCGDATGNPWLMRVARADLGGATINAQRLYRVNSTTWFSIKASADGSRWLFSASPENQSFALDSNVHLYAVEDQGDTVTEVAQLAPDSEWATPAIAPVGKPDNIGTGNTFWLMAHNLTSSHAWKCRLARGDGFSMPKAFAGPVAYAWQTFNTTGSITVAANSAYTVLGRASVPTYAKKLQIFDAGVWDDADTGGLTTDLRVRVVNKTTRALLYECRYSSHRDIFHNEAGGPVATITTLTASDAIEVIVQNVGTASASGTAYVTLGWGA